MRRSTAGRQRGIQRGLSRRRLNSSKAEFFPTQDIKNYYSLRRAIQNRRHLAAVAAKLSQKCFSVFCSACYRFCAVTLKEDNNGYVERASLLRCVIFCVEYSLIVFGIVHKLYTGIMYFSSDDDGLETKGFLCLLGFWSQLIGLCVGSGPILLPKLTMELMNSWSGILESIGDFRSGVTISPLSNLAVSLQIIISFIGTTFGIAVMPLLSFYFADVPIFALPALEEANVFIVKDILHLLPPWARHLLLYPLDLFQYGVPLLPYMMSTSILIYEIGIFKLLLAEMRLVPTTNSEYRTKIQKLYITMQVHERVLSEWVQPMLMQTLFSVGGAIVLCLFFSLKHPELPIILHIVFISLALCIMGIVFWVSFDAVNVIRASQEVVDILQSSSSSSGEFIRRQEQHMLQRSKALQPVVFPIGTFGEFSLEVPAIMWEEILNQLVFLLSF